MASDTGLFPTFVTLEGYLATSPLHFDVPPLPPGEYRIRIDATHSSAAGNVRERTATLYASLRILRASRAEEARSGH